MAIKDTIYSPEIKFSGGRYNVSVGLTDQETFAESPTRITGLQTVATDLVAEAGETELAIHFAQPFVYEAGRNLVIEFEVTEAGSKDASSANKTYFYGEKQSKNTSYYSYYNNNGLIDKQPKSFLPKVKFTEAGVASGSYLDIADYASIDAAGATVPGMRRIYKYTEDDGQAWLTFSSYGAMIVDENQNWFETSSLKANENEWAATDVFRGEQTYFGMEHSYSLYGSGTQTFYVTNCAQVKAYVEDNSYSTTNATLTIYECSRNDDYTITPAAEATDSKQGRDGVIASEDIDQTRIYKVVLSGGGDFPDILEIGFRKPLPKNEIALLNDDSQSAQQNADFISGAAGDGMVYDVTLTDRTLYKDGNWNTLCLPFDVTAEQLAANTKFAGATLMTLDVTQQNGFDTEDGTLYLSFKTATAIEAGVPYLVKWVKAADYDANPSAYDIVNPLFEGVTISSTTAQAVESETNGLETVQMVGCYSPFSVTADDKSILFLGEANTLYYSTVDLQVLSCRAYFSVPYINENAEAQARVFSLSFEGAEATGIETISNPSNPSNLSNPSNPSCFTLNGVRLNGKPTQRGMYINHGKKVVIQ